MQPEELMTGAGMVQAVPGPVFSVAAYAGGMVMRAEGREQQLLGCVIGAVAIFLPGLLLVLFFWPLWENLKKYVIIYRSLEGILAAVVGLMGAAVLYLSKDLFFQNPPNIERIHLMVVVTTIYLLSLTKIPPPFIALFCLFLGWWF
jgi:chromate transporter